MIKLTITTSVELSESEQAGLEKRLVKKYGNYFKTDYHVDDALIGGIIIFDGDKVYDGSIRTQLNKIKEKISK